MNNRISCAWILLIFLGFTFQKFSISYARSTRHHTTAVIVGTVFCDTCFQQQFSGASHFIPGATVAVQCGESVTTTTSFYKEVKTNKHGEFSVNLPVSVSKHVKKIKGCSVKLIKSSEPYCAVASTATSSSIHLKSRKQGTHIFSAGFFTFKPLNQPDLCNQKPSIVQSSNNKKLTRNTQKSAISNPNDPTFYPPIQDPPTPSTLLPPLPRLPPLPLIGRLPLPPILSPGRYAESEFAAQPNIFNPIGGLPIPPNPLLPPPSILPPIIPQPPPSIFPPLFPSPPPSIFPPIIPSPPVSPPSLFPPIFPPIIPGLTPSPPPPPPPSLFPPIIPPLFPPLIPGVPPATTSSSSSSSQHKKNLSP